MSKSTMPPAPEENLSNVPAISAILDGNLYQQLHCISHLADLVDEDGRYSSVSIENDRVDGFDDLFLEYRTPQIDRYGTYRGLFVQVKYHIDQSGSYTSAGMTEPVSEKSKTSFLQRLKRDYDKVINAGQDDCPFRFQLHSNWHAHPDDQLLGRTRDHDGRLLDDFVEGKVVGALGKVRASWLKHLGIDETSFCALMQVFRFRLSAYSLQDITVFANAKMKSCGLVGVSPSTGANPYSAYIQKRLREGRLRITREEFAKDVVNHGFRIPGAYAKSQATVAFCTYSRGTERLHEVVEYLWDKRGYFIAPGFPDPVIWRSPIAETLRAFGETVGRPRTEHHVHLECHLSIAYLVGRMWHDKTGITAFPFQKGPVPALWKPSLENRPDNWKWALSQTGDLGASEDFVCIVSGNRNIEADVRASMAENEVISRPVIHFCGIGDVSFRISCADHCYDLAIGVREELLRIIKKHPSRALRMHLYMSCPNALAFFIGQQSMAMLRIDVQCYEYTDMRYRPSLFLAKEAK
jgi:SMODS-associated and fused to various effectors sensor domain